MPPTEETTTPKPPKRRVESKPDTEVSADRPMSTAAEAIHKGAMIRELGCDCGYRFSIPFDDRLHVRCAQCRARIVLRVAEEAES